MKKRYLECGKIVSTHGIRGELKIQHWCDAPQYLLEFEALYLEQGKVPLPVELARVHKNMVILKLRGVDDIDAAAPYRGKILYLDRETAPDGDSGYFVQDLLGIRVYDADTGRLWGTLTDVLHTGANDVYEITGGDGVKRLVPVIPEVVLETDADAGTMKIRPLPGLFEDGVNGDAD